jgi:hypothetical protein
MAYLNIEGIGIHFKIADKVRAENLKLNLTKVNHLSRCPRSNRAQDFERPTVKNPKVLKSLKHFNLDIM